MNSQNSETTAWESQRRELPSSFIPGDFDVICGRGRGCFNHKGNETFRKTVDSWLSRYSAAETKLEKSAIVSAIVQTVRTQSPEGGFVKKDADTNMWYEVGDHLAREKVGQTIRDSLHSQYRSSTKSKKKRRQAEQAVANESMTQMSSSHMQISSKIDQLATKITSTTSDDQVTDMLTQANLEILNELNRLSLKPGPEPHQMRSISGQLHMEQSVATSVHLATRRRLDSHPFDGALNLTPLNQAPSQPLSPFNIFRASASVLQDGEDNDDQNLPSRVFPA